MRFDLVDLQLFIAVADQRSITRGAERSHLALASASARIKGLEDALGVALLKRGRRGVELTAAGESLLDHARIVIHQVEAMRGDLAGFASGLRASVHLLANTSGLSEHLPKALAGFLREHRDVAVDIEERESTDIAAAITAGAADLGFAAEHALPGHIERFTFSEDRLTLVTSRRGPFAGRRQIDFQEAGGCEFVGLTSATALQMHIARHAARLGLRLHYRARLRDFDAICQMVAADVGVALMPEAAARRCARIMPLVTVRLRDAWANRRLVICARNFKTLARPPRCWWSICARRRGEQALTQPPQPLPDRHGRACPGHPRPFLRQPATSPGMTSSWLRHTASTRRGEASGKSPSIGCQSLREKIFLFTEL